MEDTRFNAVTKFASGLYAFAESCDYISPIDKVKIMSAYMLSEIHANVEKDSRIEAVKLITDYMNEAIKKDVELEEQ